MIYSEKDKMRAVDYFFKEKIKIFGITFQIIDILFLISILMLGILARVCLFDVVSGDYYTAFADWMKEIRNAHAMHLPYIGVEAGGVDHISTCDYNCLYQYIIIFLNLFNNGGANDMYLIKSMSIFFDVMSAIVAFRIILEMSRNVKKASLMFAVILFIPTMILNSAAWAQNDSMYTTFLMLSFLYLLKRKDMRVWIFFAISYCVKQQAIFFLPVLIIAWLKNRLKIRYIFFIPLVYVMVIIPAAIAGAFVPSSVTVPVASLVDTGNVVWTESFIPVDGMITLNPTGKTFFSLLGIYKNQVAMFSRLSMNYPNIYTIIQTGLEKADRQIIISAGEVVTVMLMGMLAYYIYVKKVKFDGMFLVTLAFFSSSLIVYTLPCMHERYGFVAEIFAFIYGMFGFKRMCLAIMLQGITLVTYTRYLWGASSSLTTANLVVFAFIMMGIIMLIGYDLYNQINSPRTATENSKNQ